jgi:hypothetical protein
MAVLPSQDGRNAGNYCPSIFVVVILSAVLDKQRDPIDGVL